MPFSHRSTPDAPLNSYFLTKGFTGSIPAVGHWAPNSIVGVSALWKNAKKIAKNNKASQTINKSTPKSSPFCTARVWFPKKVDLLIT